MHACDRVNNSLIHEVGLLNFLFLFFVFLTIRTKPYLSIKLSRQTPPLKLTILLEDPNPDDSPKKEANARRGLWSYRDCFCLWFFMDDLVIFKFLLAALSFAIFLYSIVNFFLILCKFGSVFQHVKITLKKILNQFIFSVFQ